MSNVIGPLSLKRIGRIMLVSVLCAAAAYVISQRLPATYQASGTIRVAVPSQGGISDPDVIASNDLAAQYSQLVSSEPARALTAKAAGIAFNKVDGGLTGSAVAAQNLIEVTATADSAGAAHALAAASVPVVQQYLSTLTAQQNAQYLAVLRQDVSAAMSGPASAEIANDPPSAASSAERDQVLGQAARDAAGNQPSFQVIDPAGTASQTAPRPKLYALVAFVVALIIVARIELAAANPARR
jgi:capsular polysaccharide biosynthesis protein